MLNERHAEDAGSETSISRPVLVPVENLLDQALLRTEVALASTGTMVDEHSEHI